MRKTVILFVLSALAIFSCLPPGGTSGNGTEARAVAAPFSWRLERSPH